MTVASTPAMAAALTPAPPAPNLAWIDCVTCYAQRRQWIKHDGRWWRRDCPACGGSGQRLVER